MHNTTKSPLIDEISNLISESVPLVFETLFRHSARVTNTADFSAWDQQIVVGSVGFIGEANGMVYIHLTVDLAQKLAGQMLRLPPAELDEEMVDDVIGELSNVVVGAVKSQLCDGGSPCTLTIPSIIRGNGLSIKPLRSESSHSLHFSCGNDTVLITILMKQPHIGDDL
jgi:chemotaxis protein CheX